MKWSDFILMIMQNQRKVKYLYLFNIWDFIYIRLAHKRKEPKFYLVEPSAVSLSREPGCSKHDCQGKESQINKQKQMNNTCSKVYIRKKDKQGLESINNKKRKRRYSQVK